MKTLERFVWALGIVAVVSGARAAEVTDNHRLSPLHIEPGFSGNYIKDASVLAHKQLRAEFGGMSFPHYRLVEIRVYDFIASYGLWPNLEVGVDVPLVNLVPSRRVPDLGGEPAEQEQDVGDVSVYGRYRLFHDEHWSVVGGMEVQIESSREDIQFVPCSERGVFCRTGFDRDGFNPFGAVRYTAGKVAFGGHVGYELFDDPLGDVVNYSLYSIVALRESVAVRLEFAGLEQAKGTRRDIFSMAPGLDFHFDWLTFRIAAFKGLTGDAADWGIGGGAAVSFGGPRKKYEEEI
jgi:hypothetical protein